MTSADIVHVQWQGPYVLQEGIALSNVAADYGIYQIYGRSATYGANVLIYIGKANEQTFSKRIRQERWDLWEESEGRVTIHVGRLAGPATPSDANWRRQIDLVERLLIFAQRPARNASGVATLSPTADAALANLHVFNWGEYRALLPEVSGARWTSRFNALTAYGPYGSHQ